ncbi:MAG: tRNA pseudouridine(55) synthase TruB [Pyrinomonadaceae bacterium]
MDGILIIDKPAGITSHDVVAGVRRILRTRRVGHTGTLDPFATGVMVVLVGKATRLAQFLDKDEKEYEATVHFGFETDTGDRTGVPSVPSEMRDQDIADALSSVEWDPIFNEFLGETDQIPPMYSAKKIDGQKLYEIARKGERIERKPVRVTISKLEFVDKEAFRIRVVCSAGTYIRTLAEDIGRTAGIGAHLAELRRTRSGRFTIDQSITLDALGERHDPQTKLLDMTEAVVHLPAVTLDQDRAEKTRNGLSTRLADPAFADGEPIRMLDENGNLLAVGAYDEAERSVNPKVVLS